MRSPDFLQLTAVAVLALLTQAGTVAAAADVSTALSSGTPHLQARIRAELVEQDNLLEDAAAVSARVRLGYTTLPWQQWQRQIEFEATEPFGGEAYNSLRNGHTSRSTVADPDGDEVNQAWLEYQGLPDSKLRLGRSRLILDNARFIGNVGWRQNEQTYDGYHFTNTSLPGTRLFVAQLNNVNAPLFNNRPMDTQLFNLSYSGWAPAQFTAYHYRIDFDQSTADHRTSGLRATGAVKTSSLKWPWSAEFARQSDHGEAAARELDYLQLGIGVKTRPLLIAVAYEELGGDGSQGFATPLATLHGHNGWADIFLATPGNGLRDLSLKLAGQGLGLQWTVVAHDFAAARGSSDYGRELDLSLKRNFAAGLSALLKFAVYEAASNSGTVDTRKAWLQLEYGF